jgi:hypothetical protein
MTRGWVCRLQFLLALASAFILRSESLGLMTTFHCLRFETPPNWRVRFPYLYPPRTGWPSYTRRHWVPYQSPFTTPRTTVEVFDPASTRECPESESSITTDGQLASLSWNRAPIGGLRPHFRYCQTVTGLLTWGALSDERTGPSFTIAADPRQHSHSRGPSPPYCLSFEIP